jgi:hypothetical protein
MSQPDDTQGRSGLPLRRRDLLVWSSAAALAPAFTGIARAQEVAAPGNQQLGRSMSVGFVEGSEVWPSFKTLTAGTLARGRRPSGGPEPEAARVTPAAEMGVGDQGLINTSVRVGIHGLYPIPNPVRVKRVDLTVLFPSPEPGIPRLPFYAWSYKSKPAPNPSPPLKFTAPIGPEGSFQLLLDVVPNDDDRRVMTRRATLGMFPDAPGGNFAADFTVDWQDGRPKLQRGIYLLGLAPNTWSASRTLPIYQPRASRPLELLSLIVSVDPIVA